MDLNREYAAHQQALMAAKNATSEKDRLGYLSQASSIAERIGTFQQQLGAAASCAWCASQFVVTPAG